MSTTAYYTSPDGEVQLYLGDMREVLPELGLQADLVLADPPYGETALAWDRWPDGWLDTASEYARSMWCFGSMRMFGDRWPEFRGAGWKLSQDVVGKDRDAQPVFGDVHTVWEKHNGSGFATDRFKRVHEHATHWYRGDWRDVGHDVPTEKSGRRGGGEGGLRATATARDHTGTIGTKTWDGSDGVRLLRSVLQVRSMHGRAINETEKPLGIVEPLIRYGCPPGGLVVEVFAGSCSALDAARQSGRRAIGIELRESQCEAAARRLDQLTLEAT